MSTPAETVVACLTPPGAAAIATLALHGPDAWSVTRRLFRPHSRSSRPLPEQPEVGRIWVGRLGGDVADEVVLAVRRDAPVLWVELHCHGGPEVLRLLLETFQTHGVRVCSWYELERRTTGDALQAAAAVALAEAPTVRTAAILLDQHQGACARALESIRAALDRADVTEVGRLLAELARYTAIGRRLMRGWRVVVAGAPNVGKSSLVNALAGYQRSVVSAVPGTTRDVVTTRVAIDGWPLELADTAGLREEGTALEAQGIQRARETVAAADLCLWVFDAAGMPVWPPGGSPSPLAENVQLVINKMDLPPAWDLSQAAGAMCVSARTGEGLADLCQALAGRLAPDPPPPGAAVPFTHRLCDWIEEVQRYGSAGRFEDLRRALQEPPEM